MKLSERFYNTKNPRYVLRVAIGEFLRHGLPRKPVHYITMFLRDTFTGNEYASLSWIELPPDHDGGYIMRAYRWLRRQPEYSFYNDTTLADMGL